MDGTGTSAALTATSLAATTGLAAALPLLGGAAFSSSTALSLAAQNGHLAAAGGASGTAAAIANTNGLYDLPTKWTVKVRDSDGTVQGMGLPGTFGLQCGLHSVEQSVLSGWLEGDAGRAV